jgi:hypothetical protein
VEHHHKRVRFFSTVELVNALEQEKAVGTSGARGAVRAQCVNVGLREDEDFVVVA